MIKVKDYLLNSESINVHDFTCQMCNDLAINPVRCLDCKGLYCKECSDLIQTQGKNCYLHKGKLASLLIDESMNKVIKEELLFRCMNKDCKVILTYDKITFHYLICDKLLMNCPFDYCEFKGKEADINSHVKICKQANSVCYVCWKKFNQEDKKNHNCLSIMVEELINLEKELNTKHRIYEDLIESMKKSTLTLIKDKGILSNCCKKCYSRLVWLDYLERSSDCEESTCVGRSRYYCEKCCFYFCIKCFAPSQGLVCGCTEDLKRNLHSEEGEEERNCDKCGIKIEFSNYYRCEKCDYDVCPDCY
jgi:hypothetical protein